MIWFLWVLWHINHCRLFNAKSFLYTCNILTFGPAINQGTGASSQRYQDINLTVDGLNSVQLRRPREAGGREKII